MHIYRLIPVAEADDPNWSLSPDQGEVIVRARTSGDARVVAAEAEADFLQHHAKPGEGVSTADASAFRNEKLYTVIEDLSGRYVSEGPRQLLSGSVDPKVILPLTARGPGKG
ncbi:hypothetical protein [Rhizobium sp. C1]|uniref:hypothetical protein n=1 Tax=Rhizobium sp. C1 TaxID=1349799 RepID=UPI001E406FE8|nr:hypothetical protein [Rhizobium sp. C1]MCD2178141.1 hypothetical protein [Rhizobium sp. C1]